MLEFRKSSRVTDNNSMESSIPFLATSEELHGQSFSRFSVQSFRNKTWRQRKKQSVKQSACCMEFVKIAKKVGAGIPSLVTSEDPFVQSFSSISFMQKQNIASRKETSYKT